MHSTILNSIPVVFYPKQGVYGKRILYFTFSVGSFVKCRQFSDIFELNRTPFFLLPRPLDFAPCFDFLQVDEARLDQLIADMAGKVRSMTRLRGNTHMYLYVYVKSDFLE